MNNTELGDYLVHASGLGQLTRKENQNLPKFCQKIPKLSHPKKDIGCFPHIEFGPQACFLIKRNH